MQLHNDVLMSWFSLITATQMDTSICFFFMRHSSLIELILRIGNR